MTRFAKLYQTHKEKKERKNIHHKMLNREGYGYIKRRLGLLSVEVGKPTYLINENS